MFRLSFRAELNGLKFDKGKESKTRETKLQRCIYQSTQAWFSEVFRIAIWRGFAKGSVVFARGLNGDLARYLRMITSPEAQIVSYKTQPRYYRHDDGRKVPKRPDRGGVFGHYAFSYSQGRYRFTFRSDVVYFALNDMFARGFNYNSPWQFLQYAAISFKEQMLISLREQFKGHLTDCIVKVPLYKSDGKGSWTKYQS